MWPSQMSLSNIKVNKSTVIGVDNEPTFGSDNLVKSGGVGESLLNIPSALLGGRVVVKSYLSKGLKYIKLSDLGYTNSYFVYFKVPAEQAQNFPNQAFGFSNDTSTIATYKNVTWIDQQNGYGYVSSETNNFQYLVFTYVNLDIHISILSSDYVEGKIKQSNTLDIINNDIPHIEYSVNLFNKEEVITGKYITIVGYSSASMYKISHPILFKKNKTYKWAYGSGMGVTAAVAIVEKDTTIITTKSTTVSGGFETITLDKDCLVCVNIGKGSADSFMVCEESLYPNTYVPYKESLDKYVTFQEGTNPLSGKIIAFDGDSICYGAGYIGGYASIIGNRNNMTVENRGGGGATLATETYDYVGWKNGQTLYYTLYRYPNEGIMKAYTNTSLNQGETTIDSYDADTNAIIIGGVSYVYSSSDSQARHWISTDVLNLRSDADYVIIEGGVNDGYVLGSYSASYDETFNPHTFYGAVDTLCKNLLSRFGGKKIGFIIVHGVTETWSFEGTRYGIVKRVLQKWGIPILDLMHEVPPFGLLPQNDTLRTTYTQNGDGWHPNEQGYKKYYCDKIESWMKTL